MSLEGRVIGIVEDDPIMGESLLQSLQLEGCRVHWWTSGSQALQGMADAAPDLVVCDIRLPDMTGESVFRRAATSGAMAPFMFMTAFGDIDQAVALMRAGAADYMPKPFETQVFLERAKTLLMRHARQAFGDVLGVSASMRSVETLLRRIAERPSTVLFTGETGVGKEVCARFLHGLSGEATRPFMAVNCAAIPAELLENELFGHERGAFSGAVGRHLGYAERARNGVLFLDEIGELPLALQAKLLRLVDERVFFRLGGEQPVPFKGRFVCATNQDLAAQVRAGSFREDLLYRINVVTLRVPPLRERREDISWLMEQFFDELVAAAGSPLRGIGAMAEDAALAYGWPGNVRELRNRMERAVALALGEWLMPGDLFPERPALSPDSAMLAPLAKVRDAAERRQIERALRQTGGQIALAAQALGISRTTMWEKMRRHHIDPPEGVE